MNGESTRPRLGAFAGEPMPNELERTPSTGGWRPPARAEAGTPSYGFDAPWYTARTFGVAAAAALAAALARTVRIGGRPLPFAPVALAGIATVCAATGASLVAYATLGKFKHRERVLDIVAWHGRERVLDIGTGGGLLMIGAAKRLSTGRAFGVDTWRESDLTGNNRETTMRNAFLEGVVDKIDVRYTDARKLDFGRNSFDVVFATLVLHAIDDAAGREAACREIARVLRPGGVAIVSDHRVAGYAGFLRDAGLDVRTLPPTFESFTYLRTLVATKAALVDLTAGLPA